VNASERFGCCQYVDPSPGLTGPVGRYHQAASLVAVPDGQNADTAAATICLFSLACQGADGEINCFPEKDTIA